ncbi:MAG TPA: hypothetical protein VK453_25570 [Micromonosporaceae bacterium]|nr:hypothetical protein [Micromonosporaceae bacterium]
MSPDRPDHITEPATAMQAHVLTDGSLALGITTKSVRLDVTLTPEMTSQLTDRLVYDTAHVKPAPAPLQRAA